tara:strand:+ start:2253 stop:2666 length:414 start_codon:yes stop_codon:yes gene_type:complete
MATKVLLKKSSVSARVPTTSDLDYGEVALNYADGKLFFKTSTNQIDFFPAASAGAGSSTEISQGNSSIAVADTGTGLITTTVDGTSVSTSTAAGIALLEIPTAPTAAVNTQTTQIATTEFAVREALNKAVAMSIALG